MTLPNLGLADYDNGWPANRHRVYPAHFAHTSFSTTAGRERPCVSAVGAHSGNEFCFSGQTLVVICRVKALAARPRCFLLPLTFVWLAV